MELLSPAGSIEKLFYAYEYGADAAYIGLKNFSLRAKADNFNNDEYNEIKKIKKNSPGSGSRDQGNKKLYAALNIYFHDSDIKKLEEESEYISLYPIDAFIISDPGILPVLQKYFPRKEFHLSTQANCVNSNSAKLYRDMGFSRIIPGRELSLKEIEAIKNNVDNLEIEVFVHGAMCLAYSGRCFLSKYLADRSANKGDCSHSCRWQYRVLEESEREGEFFPVIEGENFTSILSSKDICMIDHLQDLKNAGVDSLKIEGRMKSVYYTAVVTRAYRKAIDSLEGKKVENLESYKDELLKVSHREFSTGFFYGKEEIEKPTFKSYEREYSFLGTVSENLTPEPCANPGLRAGTGHTQAVPVAALCKNTASMPCTEHNIHVADCYNESNNSKETFLYKLDVKNQIRISDIIEYIGPDIIYLEDSGFLLFDENMKKIDKTDHGKITYLQTDKILNPGYIIRKKAD